jgi:hypothetical protein
MFLLHNTKYLRSFLGIKRLASGFWRLAVRGNSNGRLAAGNWRLAIRGNSLGRNTDGCWRLATCGWLFVVIVCGEFQKIVYW